MSKINIDFNSILQPIKDAQNELTKLLSQMQEASKASQSMAAGIRSSGGSRFSSIEAAGNYVKNMRSIHGDNVIAMPGVPLSNLDPSQHASSPTTSPTNPIAQAARANVSSNLDSVSFARALNTSFDLQKSAPNRQAMINNLQKGDQVSKYFGNQMSDIGTESANLQKQIADLSKQALDSNGREIKANTEANKKLQEAISQLNKTNDKLASIQDEANKYLKGAGGGDGGGPTRGMFGRAFNAIGGIQGASRIGAVGLAGGQIYNTIQRADVFAELQARGNTIGAQNALYHQQMSAAAPASGRDMLRAYGNLMAPDLVGSNSFIGTNGLSNARMAATNIQAKELATERTGAVLGVLGSMATGAVGGAVAGTIIPGLGNVTGGIIGGIGGLVSGIAGLSGNKYVQSQGGVAGYTLGLAGPQADRQRRLFESSQLAQAVQLSQQIQEQELNRPEMERRARGLDIRTAAMSAMLAGTSLVGGRSVNGLDMMAGTSLSRVGQEISGIRNNYSPEVVMPRRPSAREMELMPVTGAQDLMSYNLATVRSTGRAMDIARQERAIEARKAAIGDRAARTAADLLMDPAEFGQTANMFMAYGGRRQDAYSFAKMRFAGVGGSEQLASQMFGLQSSTNTPLQLSEFKKVLSEGVAAGFSSAPLMQAFMGTLTQLSQSLGTTNVNALSGDLNMMSAGLSVTGKGGMRSLREAAMAMSSMGSYTGQTSGVVGMMKTVAGYSGGLSIQSGLSVANTMNSAQLTETRDSLEKIANSSDPQKTLNELERSGKISKDASRIARTNMANVGGAARALGAMADASQAQIRGVVNLALGGSTTFGDISKRMGALMQQKGGTRTEEFKNLEAQLSVAIEGSGVDRNAAFMMARDAAFSGMSVEQRASATRNLRASGGEFGQAQREGEARAKTDKFLAAQKSLNARLGTEAAIEAGGFASESTISGVAKDLGTDAAGLRKRLGLGEKDKIRSEDLAGLAAQGAGAVNTVNIGGFASSALNSLGLAFSIALNKGESAKSYTGTAAGVKPE